MRFVFLPDFIGRFVNPFGNAGTYGIYIPRVFVPSRFLRGSWLSTFATDVSRGHSSLGERPAIKN
jgi:hypothetical protein